MNRIKFKPKTRIKRVVNGKELIMFYTSVEYEGTILKDGTILAETNKCDKTFHLRKKEVTILNYL